MSNINSRKLFICISCLCVLFCISRSAKNSDGDIQTNLEQTDIVYAKSPLEVHDSTGDAPEQIYIGDFTVTAYCSCQKCCGVWANNRPKDENGTDIVYTASGERATQGTTIAADTSILPFGTKVSIDGHIYIVQDTGGSIKGNKIDIYFSNHQDALNFGKQNKSIYKIVDNEVIQ